jgi:ATP-dependent DNA ligase
LIDGEAIVCDENGLAVFDLIRRHGALASAVLCAFDLVELDSRDLRREPIEERKRLLAKLLKEQQMSIVLNETYGEDGEIVFREACRLGCEGVVSKRLGSIYRRGRSPYWIKVKNPNAPAVKREAEEDWGSPRWIRSKHRTVVTRGADRRAAGISVLRACNTLSIERRKPPLGARISFGIFGSNFRQPMYLR